MSVIQSLQNLANLSRIGRQSTSTSGLKPFLAVEGNQNADFRTARTHLLRLYRNLEQLADVAGFKSRFKLDLPDALSANSLLLDLSSTAASLTSVEEINASPMSFTPFGPDWNDGSSALLTFGGEYDGSNGTGAFNFEVRRAGTHGTDNLRIRVEDPQGGPVQNISIDSSDAEDTQYSINNGLYFTLGPGDLVNRDTTTIQVFDNIGAVVDPGNPLGGLRNSNPNLQFGGPSILDGSFFLNGQSISVTTTDTINDVIDRINLSSGGVTATFNDTLERIDFLQNQTGSLPTIDLQSDTSNFLQAMKLDTAVVTAGIDPESEQALENVAVFSSVQSGDIVINGQQITIDATSDSLVAVIDKINASSAGAVASFDTETQKVLIEAADPNGVLEIDSNGTGLFAALQIAEGRVDPEAVSNGVSRRRSYEIADATAAVFEELNFLLRDASFNGGSSISNSIRGPLEATLRALIGSDASDRFGMQFGALADAKSGRGYASIDRPALTQNLQLRGASVQGFLGDTKDTNGLISSLLEATRSSLLHVNKALGLSGSVIDTYV